MLPVYFQGSVIGAFLGVVAILLLGWLFVREKRLDLLVNLSVGIRRWIVVAVLALWCASFINVGIRQTPSDRVKFDSVGKLVSPTVEPVTRPLRTPQDVIRDADALREKIDAGNLNK